ncbi:MAG TPA: hypothetical protein VMU80_08765 [Bryobacteraceae bacterium]|nr:hypothetical protein [Bryobacteraceae bacterium]
MKRFWLLPMLAASLMAADVSGKWAGHVEVADPSGGETINATVRAELHQQGDAISGTIGRQEDQETETIQNAKLDGARLTFEVSSAETNGLIKFVLTLDGDKLDGQMSGTMDGADLNGKVHLTRQKP